MQQQAALMAAAAQGGYGINPMAALAAAHMQQINALAPNGLTSAAITPTTTGEADATSGPRPYYLEGEPPVFYRGHLKMLHLNIII